MKRVAALTHEFVDFIPDKLEDGMIYVSMGFATAVHRCCCGCGKEVVTPLSPTDWKLIFDGKSVSLDPSIGNWSFDCKSHYWIKNNRVKWAARWSEEQIAIARSRDEFSKKAYYNTGPEPAELVVKEDVKVDTSKSDNQKQGFWQRLRKWWQ
jgi:hypothetical protein